MRKWFRTLDLFERFTDEKIGCSCGKRLTWKQAGNNFGLVLLSDVSNWLYEDTWKNISYEIPHYYFRKYFGR